MIIERMQTPSRPCVFATRIDGFRVVVAGGFHGAVRASRVDPDPAG
jgi:hypothetical protein